MGKAGDNKGVDATDGRGLLKLKRTYGFLSIVHFLSCYGNVIVMVMVMETTFGYGLLNLKLKRT